VGDAPTVSFDVRQDRRLIWYRGESARYLTISIKCDPQRRAEADEAVKSFNVGLAIDVSPTMAGLPLDAAKQIALTILAGLDDSDRLSIIAFSGEARAVCVREAVGANRTHLQQLINQLETGPESNLRDGWLEACLCVAAGMDGHPDSKARVFLLSDGRGVRTGEMVSELAQHARALEKRRLPTAAIGIGGEISIAPLAAIDDRGGNSLATATSPSELAQLAISEYLSREPGVVIDASIELVLPPDVRAQFLPDLVSEPSARRKSIEIGDLPPGAEKHYVAKLLFSESECDDLFDIRVFLSGLDQDGQDFELGHSVQYRAARGRENSFQQRDEEVAKLVLSAWVSAVLSTVLKLHEEGKFQEISDFMNTELGYLNRYIIGREEWSAEIARLKAGLSMLHRPWRTP
jgi:hypothetical protein